MKQIQEKLSQQFWKRKFDELLDEKKKQLVKIQ